MSSTTNVQNLLVNVFRPTYTYDTTAAQFVAKLDLSNINTVYANVFSGLRADIADQSNNVYVGTGSGNPIDTLNACANNTVLGYNAGSGMSNVSNSIYIGNSAGFGANGATNTIAMGNTAVGNGDCNIYIGNSTGGSGDSNLFIGHDISADPTVSNTMYIGFDTPLITGKFAEAPPNTRRVGILDSNPQYPISLGSYTYVLDGLGINANPADHTLNVVGDCRIEDGFGLFQFDQNQTTSNSIFSVESYTPGKILEATIGSATNDASMNVYGTLNVDKGYSSVRGTTGSLADGVTSNIGLWKKGMVIVAVTGASAGPRFGGSWIYDGTTATSISSNAANITVTGSGSNIVLSNTSAGTTTFGYNITYFPTP